MAGIIAKQISARCCSLKELGPDDFLLCLALTADSLPSLRIPNGRTFALAGYSPGIVADDAPDLTGVPHPHPIDWEAAANQPLLAQRVAQYPLLKDEAEWWVRQKLRPLLQAVPGWEERLAARPEPTQEELRQRLRAGDATVLDLPP